MTILIEIPTRNRDSVLGRCFAALLAQSHQDFDVLVLNDGDESVGKTQTTEYLLNELRRHHEVFVERGSHISQAHNHNVPLYDKRFLDYTYIVRLDDDILLNRMALQYMFETITETGAGAVGGLWFEMEWLTDTLHDRAIIDDLATNPSTTGKVGPFNSNWQHRMYHPTNELFEVEHLYSVCIYDAEAMRLAGGWPEVYSKGVAHGEETDGTYRLHLSGWELYIDPRVTGQHLRAPGGIRDKRDLNKVQSMDLVKWQVRLPKLEGIDFEPTVAVECQHAYGFGGAERLFYHTVHLLQSNSGLGTVHPVLTGLHLSPQECQDIFGFTYEKHELLEEYDVCIVIGHEPTHFTKAKKYIFYNLFPLPIELTSLQEFSLILGISEYTCEHIKEMWKQETKCLYPPIVSIGQGDVEKENIVLCVARCVPYKAPLWLMQRFVEMGLEDWEFHVVSASGVEAYADYEEQTWAFAEQNDNVVMHRNIPSEALHNLYRRAKILWSASGMMSKAPQAAEHFGYTPIEAWSAGCVPVVFDRGGHKETVAERNRWATAEELKERTLYLVSEGPVTFTLGGEVVSPPCQLDKFNEQDYAWQWEQWIRRVNAMALELDPIEQIEVKTGKIRVAAISDSPRLTTGFGVVVNEIYSRIVQQDDMELCVFGFMDPMLPLPDEKLPYHFFPSPLGDMQGRGDKTLPAFLAWAQPDVVFELYDPGNMMGHVKTLRTVGYDGPIVAYFPIEGEPISKATYNLVQTVDFPVTYCKAGVESIKRVLPDADVGYCYHGANHAPFEPLADDERAHLRRLVGWDDKFILCNVGSNKRVKQQPYLIEALRILLEQGHDDIYLYLHTRQFDSHVMNGWTLDWIRDYLSLAHDMEELRSHILFPMAFDKWRGPPYKYQDSLEAWRMTTAPTAQMRGAIFNAMDMITRYQLADLYVDVSSAEGWGLGPLEAIACGTPTISVADGHVRSEVHSKYCNMMLKPAHWTTWHTSARLQLVSPTDIAESVLEVKEDYETEKNFALEMSKAVMTDLPWEDTAMYFVDLIRRAHGQNTK